MPLEEGATSILRTSAGLKAGETVLVVADPERMGVGRAIFYAAAALGTDPVLALIRTREGPRDRDPAPGHDRGQGGAVLRVEVPQDAVQFPHRGRHPTRSIRPALI